MAGMTRGQVGCGRGRDAQVCQTVNRPWGDQLHQVAPRLHHRLKQRVCVWERSQCVKRPNELIQGDFDGGGTSTCSLAMLLG